MRAVFCFPPSVRWGPCHSTCSVGTPNHNVCSQSLLYLPSYTTFVSLVWLFSHYPFGMYVSFSWHWLSKLIYFSLTPYHCAVVNTLFVNVTSLILSSCPKHLSPPHNIHFHVFSSCQVTFSKTICFCLCRS